MTKKKQKQLATSLIELANSISAKSRVLVVPREQLNEDVSLYGNEMLVLAIGPSDYEGCDLDKLRLGDQLSLNRPFLTTLCDIYPFAHDIAEDRIPAIVEENKKLREEKAQKKP